MTYLIWKLHSLKALLPSRFNLSSCIIPKDDSYLGIIQQQPSLIPLSGVGNLGILYVILCIPDSQIVILFSPYLLKIDAALFNFEVLIYVLATGAQFGMCMFEERMMCPELC